MDYKTLISMDTLSDVLHDPNLVIIDCHFLLEEPNAGVKSYQQAHIPRAIYAHLDRDLAGPIIPGKSGRHPLPDITQFTQTLSRWGIDATTQVVAYDNSGGGIAARLWWMLKWLGHERVAVLNGSFSHWKQAGLPVEKITPTPPTRNFIPNPNPQMFATLETMILHVKRQDVAIVDSRAPERYRGEIEPLDKVAGHIPGAINLFFSDNLAADGLFKDSKTLKDRFENSLGKNNPSNTIFYCGSGVTSAHNILAMVYAGLGMAKLYPGSWSEWIQDPQRPIATN